MVPAVGLDSDLLKGKSLSSSGARWDVIPYVQSDGSIELGNVIDFHETSNDISDGAARITVAGGNMTFSGALTVTGNITSTSDIRIKSNIRSIDNALNKTCMLSGVYFTNTLTNENSIGLIAQNVNDVIPEAANMQNNGLLSVTYGNLVGLLVEAIKELRAEVKSLKGEQ